MFVVNRGPDKDIFNDWEVNQITELLDKIRKVLEDNNLVKEANLKLKQLSRIFELGNEIKLDLNLEDTLAHITKSIRKTLGWNDVVILRGNEFKKKYGTISKLGFDSKKDMPLDIFSEVDYDEVEKFLLNCKKIGHSYFYDTHPVMVSGNGAGFLDEVVTEWHNEDLLIVPIETRKDKLGFFVIRDPVDRMKPTSDKVTSLEYYANQAAVAIENANLYENLQTSEERYRTLAETMTLCLVTCSPDGKILYVNPAFEAISGLKRNVLIDQKLSNLFSADSQSKLQEIAILGKNAKDQSGKNIENVELELLSASGETIPVSTFAFSLWQEGEIRGFFLVMNDLRVMKKLERLKAYFNSMIVHDLRSPMNVIQGFIELIRTRVVGEINTEQEELLDIAKENVKKVLTLIDNFLVASKLEVGKFGIEPKVGEINALIERIIENHQVLLKNKNIILKSDLNQNLPLLYFDSLRIEQVFNNLLSNALKFTPEQGRILVKSGFHQKNIKGEEKMFAKILVQDTGPGIPEEKQKYVFEKYEQVDSESSLKSAGTGLGLAICKEIIGLHGGEIWIESNEKRGSQFYFTLPIEPSIDKVLK
jgi:PAS domain S-box-containing protein